MSEPPTVTATTWWMKVRGLLFCIFVLLSALMGSIYILMPLLPLMFLKHTLWRRLIDRLVGFWMFMPAGLIEVLFGAHVTISGKKIDHSEPALIIMNHRTCLDWLFFWNALIRMDPWLLTSQKISLKAVIRYMPGAGWAMAANAFMFLKRCLKQDEDHIEAMIDYYARSGHAYQLLLFPEGTDKDHWATERSRQYALKKNLAQYDYVLHPRTAGFNIILRKMRQVGYVKNIYDVTVGYADLIVQSEFQLILQGACPKNIHFHVSKVDIDSLPEQDESVTKWLINRWNEKESKLSYFYNNSNLEQQRTFMKEPNDVVFELTTRDAIIYGAVVLFWLYMSAFLLFAFFHYPSQHFLAMLTVIIFVGSEYFFGGFERVAISNRQSL